MYIILEFIIIWNLLSVAFKTAQRNSQHCTKLCNEVHNVLHNKVYWKLEFSVCFDFVKQTKNKIYILKYSSY